MTENNDIRKDSTPPYKIFYLFGDNIKTRIIFSFLKLESDFCRPSGMLKVLRRNNLAVSKSGFYKNLSLLVEEGSVIKKDKKYKVRFGEVLTKGLTERVRED